MKSSEELDFRARSIIAWFYVRAFLHGFFFVFQTEEERERYAARQTEKLMRRLRKRR